MSAQSAVEVFGGYTINNMKPERNFDTTRLNGWNTTVTGYATRRFGITGDVAGSYGTVSPTSTAGAGNSVDASQYSFMTGPQFRLMQKERFNASVRAVFGAAHGSLSIPTTTTPSTNYGAGNDTVFASLVGSNFDVNVNKRFALRFSPGLYLTQFNGETQKNLRFSVGPVFRFGARE